jgi:hypothetical protein
MAPDHPEDQCAIIGELHARRSANAEHRPAANGPSGMHPDHAPIASVRGQSGPTCVSRLVWSPSTQWSAAVGVVRQSSNSAGVFGLSEHRLDAAGAHTHHAFAGLGVQASLHGVDEVVDCGCGGLTVLAGPTPAAVFGHRGSLRPVRQ